MNVFFRTRLFPAPCSQQSEHLIRRLHTDADRLLRARQIAEIADAHPAAPVLVFVGGTNAAAGRADVVFLFPGAIEQLVIRQREVRAVGNVQLVLGADAPRRQRIELGEQLLGIEHHAVADDADRALEDPRGNLMQHEGLALARVHRMPRVRAPLVAHHQISALGQDVDDLAFAFIAPLSANHDDALCLWSEHGVVLAGNKKGPDWGPGSAVSSVGSYAARSTRASPAAILAAPSNRTRSVLSAARCTTSMVRQFPLRIVTHSRATRARAMPSTITGNQRHGRA